jgi:hypothetical protein
MLAKVFAVRNNTDYDKDDRRVLAYAIPGEKNSW